jgi:pimeloyl-ACP methyl ester carboxylesterase
MPPDLDEQPRPPAGVPVTAVRSPWGRPRTVHGSHKKTHQEKALIMSVPTGLATADLLHIEAANGITYAYRRFGNSGHGIPLVFLQHFRGNIDNWDPALIDAIAAEREVILFDNIGVGGTTGSTPDSVEAMASGAVAFLEALGLRRVDLFGFSLGGFIAQDVALSRPELVRRLILAGTGPKGAPGMQEWRDDVVKRVVEPDAPGPEDVLYVFYTPTPTSQAAGQASLGRIFARQQGRDAETSQAAKNTQYHQAVLSWGVQDWDSVQRLATLAQPTLILQGDSDIMIPPKASHTMAGLIPDARIKIYPDASHGSIFQYAEEAAADTLTFLAE